jgi:collagenase-like PrtC family protease
MREMGKKNINIFLPGFYENFRLIIYLHDWMEREPELFYDGMRIAAAYGCFPGNIWNGGRVVLGLASKTDIAYAVQEYNDRGIAIRYTYTNPCLEQIHLLDTYCNLCMRMADNGKNEVLVNSMLLEDFIRAKYPNYKLISSTTKCLSDMELIQKELEKDYHLVVLDSAMNNTDALFALDHRDKIELIVNHYCADNCPRRREHYRLVGEAQLEYDSVTFPCDNIRRSFQEIQANRSFISPAMIYDTYVKAGFYNFKLDGRGFKKEKIIESFSYYLAKPEHRTLVQKKLSEVAFTGSPQ